MRQGEVKNSAPMLNILIFIFFFLTAAECVFFLDIDLLSYTGSGTAKSAEGRKDVGAKWIQN